MPSCWEISPTLRDRGLRFFISAIYYTLIIDGNFHRAIEQPRLDIFVRLALSEVTCWHKFSTLAYTS